MNEPSDRLIGWALGTFISWAIVLFTGGLLWGCPHYNVWQANLGGQASLARALQDRQIKVAEARAAQDAAVLLAAAEVNRAKGVARANKIIGRSLEDNEAYLRYLWIQGLQDNHAETIYVPTEANLPILEAMRKLHTPREPKQ